MAAKHRTGRAGVRAGAESFFDLLDSLREECDRQLNEACDDDLDDVPRDYVALSALVESAVERSLVSAGATHREGFIRALTDLLCMTCCDDSLPNVEAWDPIEGTEAAFSAARRSRAVVARVAREP